MAGEKREVKVTLDIEQAKGVNQAFRDIGQAAQQFQDQARKSGATAGSSFGTAFASAAGFGKALAGGLVGGAVVNAGASIARAGYDQYLTSGQAGRQIFRDVVPFGSRIQGTFDAFSGRAAGFQQEDIASQRRQVFNEFAQRNQALGLSLNPELAGGRARLADLRSTGPIFGGNFDRSTSAGERSFQESQKLLPIEREIAKASREARASTIERMQVQTELSKIEARGNTLIRERVELDKKLTANSGSGVERQGILRRLEDTNNAIAANQQQQEAGQGQLRGARGREAEAKRAEQLQFSARAEARAEILENRAATSAGHASGLGMMNPFDRARSVDAFKMLQQFRGDLSMLPPDMQGLAMQVGGAGANKLVENFGRGTSEFRQMQKLLPDQYAGDPEQLRRDAQQARNEAEKLRNEAEQGVTRAGVEAGQRMGDAIGKILLQLEATMIQRIMVTLGLQKNAP